MQLSKKMSHTPNRILINKQLTSAAVTFNRSILSSNNRDQYITIIKRISELFTLPTPFTTRDIHLMDVNKVPFIIYHLIIDIDQNAIFQKGNIPNNIIDMGNNNPALNDLLFRCLF